MEKSRVNTEKLACFSLGSNLGDRFAFIQKAGLLLEERAGRRAHMSGMYESPSWGYESNLAYINSCLAIYSEKEPLELMEIALEIEEQMGRHRDGNGYSDRVIDIDLLLVEDLVVDHPRLILPHPRMSERRFVLLPLAEILPEMRHPVSGLTISRLLEECSDKSAIKPV